MITQRVINILEFDKIRAMLALRCNSSMGKALAEELMPQCDYETVAVLQAQTAEASNALIFLGKNPVDSFYDVRASLKKAHATAGLGLKELLDIAKTMRASRLCRDALNNDKITGHLNRLAAMLHSCRSAEDEIFRCILSEDEIADSASPRLAAIRRQMRSCNDRVRDKLNNMINSKTVRTYLQEPIITMRGGRYVIPVKQEYRSNVPGLLHDQSGSGATLFIEPMAVVEIGNELKKLEIDEREEIERILSALTLITAEHANDLLSSMDILAAIDVIFAKADLAYQMRAVRPELNSTHYMRINAGRHPLIPKDTVVPIDLWLGKDFQTLIITGPNTGGKTVTLKTAGLFALMAQAGLFLSAQDGVVMPVFENVYADIGDEQSIEQSLSTFSSHMKNIVSILDTADKGSLVLLDELGSGTDPLEGAALAMAVLEELHGRGCISLATTHYSELKAFALTQRGMENACVEFDVRTLRPTYRLFIGIPGKSNAFEISRRLGLPERIVKSASKHMDGKDVRFEDVISSAESQRRIAEEERLRAQEAREELYRLRDAAEKERKALEQQRDKAVKRAQAEAQAIIRSAKDDADKIIKKLKAAQQSDPGSARLMQEARDELRAAEQKSAPQQNIQAKDEAASGEPPKSVGIGDNVYVVSLDAKGSVLAAQGEDITVQAGILKLNVKLKDIRLISKAKSQPVKAGGRTGLAPRQVGLELDIRGLDAEEALIELDRYLDDACLTHLHEVSVIHGKGTGVLRAAVQDALRANPRVKSFRLGRYGEGETGVTIIQLK